MSEQRNKEIVRRFFEEIGGASLDIVERYVSPSFVNHGTPPGIPADREGIKRLFGAMFTAFPDMRFEIHHLLAEGSKVFLHKSQHGTHLGPFMGASPTGQRVSMKAVDIFELKDGLITAHWHVVDDLLLRSKLDLLHHAKAGPSVEAELLEIPTAKFEEMKRFYAHMLGTLGYRPLVELGPDDPVAALGWTEGRTKGRRVGFGIPGQARRPDFWLRESPSGSAKMHFAFTCKSPDEVRTVYDAALAGGGLDGGRPGGRSFMPTNYYGAFMIDPDGNEAEAACYT